MKSDSADSSLPAKPSTPASEESKAEESNREPTLVSSDEVMVVAQITPTQAVLIVLGVVAFLYFVRPVALPVALAIAGAITLKPLIRWGDYCHLPTPLSAAIVLCLLISLIVIGFLQLGRPALEWMNDAPQHVVEVRQRFMKLFPRAARVSQAAAAVNDLAATEEQKNRDQTSPPAVVVKPPPATVPLLNWTGSLLAGAGETLVLLYLLLASGDLFLQKLVRVMPTFRDKKRAVEISHEVQQNISNYLFSVTLINIGMGIVVGVGLYFMGVPNPGMWGMFVAVLNFIPYFGPVAGVILLAIVGLLTFDSTVWRMILPAVFYLVLHFFEANLITPVILGRRFTLNPAVIFVSLMFWMWLWGVLGALLSVPILVSIKVLCDRFPKMSSVSELLSR